MVFQKFTQPEFRSSGVGVESGSRCYTRSSSASKTSRWLSVIVLISFHLLVSYGICVQMRCIVATSLLLCPVIYTY